MLSDTGSSSSGSMVEYGECKIRGTEPSKQIDKQHSSSMLSSREHSPQQLRAIMIYVQWVPRQLDRIGKSSCSTEHGIIGKKTRFSRVKMSKSILRHSRS